MIDFHSHILPGIDDGSAALEESIRMLQMEAEQGITHVVCTPHFYPRYDTPDAFLARRDRAEEALRREMEKYPGLPEISVGAEVYYFRGICNSDLMKQLTIRGKSCIMIEMIASPWHSHVYEELKHIYHRWELTPVIAHVDRYISPLHTHGIPERLAELPVLVQANAEFFLNRKTAGMAMRLLRDDKIQLLGSDCHNLSDRKPNLGEAVCVIETRLGTTVVERICDYSHRALNIPV